MNKNQNGLKRVVGVFGLTTNIVNIVVGSGIFVLPAIVAAGLGSASVFAYLFCGFLITLVMLCFGEAGSRITNTGGAYAYIRAAFGPYFGFITAVLFVLATISADAAVANAIVDIVGSIIPEFRISSVKVLTFLVLFSLFAYINVRGVKAGVSVVKGMTITKLIPLLLLVLFSWNHVSIVNLSIGTFPSFQEIAEISLILFFAFQGAETGLSISGEVKKPNVTIPRGILISISLVLILYILIQSVSQGVLGDSLARYKENPLGAVANQVFGSAGFTIMTIAAAISMIGYLSSAILSMPRILFRAARDQAIPIPAFTRIHDRYKTPFIAIIAYASAGFLFACFGGFEQLAIIASATVLLIYLGVSLSVLKLRTRETHTKDAFKIPGGALVPTLSCCTILFLLSNLAYKEFVIIVMAIIILSALYGLRSIYSSRKN